MLAPEFLKQVSHEEMMSSVEQFHILLELKMYVPHNHDNSFPYFKNAY